MVKFGNFKKAISKKLNASTKQDDDAALIGAQAAKEASLQMQMPMMTPEQMAQYQQWQMQQQMSQVVQQTVVHPDPPTASMHAAAAPPVVDTSAQVVTTTEVASALVDLDDPTSPEPQASALPTSPMSAASSRKAKETRHEEQAQESLDEILENRDAYEPEEEEESVLEMEPSQSVESLEESVTSEEEASIESSKPSYDEETYDADATVLEDVVSPESYDGSLAACEAVGNQKKFFHKDVVLHNVGEHNAGNDLVIRAMYFVPKPKSPEDVVVRVEASTVSPRDCLMCRGVGLDRKMLPFVPGFEMIGTIQALGEEARSKGMFKEGQRVAGLSLNGGGNSRFISVPADRLFPISETVKSTSAVCLIHDYMAALKALRLAKKGGSPYTGQKILVTDGFSPVGQAIINLANMEGADIYCCADSVNHAYLISLGAKCFEKDPNSWLPSVSGSFDVVIDNSCIDAYSSSWFALNQKGTLVCLSPVYSFGHTGYDGGCGIVDFSELQKKWAAVKAKYMMPSTHFFDTLTDYDKNREQYVQDIKYLTFLLEKGVIVPKIAEKVALEDVPDAQRLLYSGRANGTIVCVPWIEN